MFKRAIGLGIVVIVVFFVSTPLIHAEETTATQTEERAVLLSKLSSLLKLLTALQLQLTQTATPLVAQSVPPQVLPDLPPPPVEFEEATN